MKKIPEPLNSDQWHGVIKGMGMAEEVAAALGSGCIRPWYTPVLERTSPGETIIETGSGSGQLSGALAKDGRKTFLLDLSMKNLVFSRSVFSCAGLDGGFVQADILHRLPFLDGSFDCVFSHGVLEHFTEEEIRYILEESARISKKTVVALVPNAASVAYRIGKWYQERNGKWQYGRETPRYSLKRYFRRAGLVNVKEYSVDPCHAFEFLTMLPSGGTARKVLNRIPPGVLSALNQGYLLVTVGEKRAAGRAA